MADEEKTGDMTPISSESVEVLLARARLHLMITFILGIPVACLGLGLLALMAVPLAHVIAGKHTDFTLTLSASFNAVLTVTTGIGAAGFAIQARNAQHHKNRSRELEKRIRQQDEDQQHGKASQPSLARGTIVYMTALTVRGTR